MLDLARTARKMTVSRCVNQGQSADMEPPPSALHVVWETTVDGNPALLFPPRLWDMISTLAEKQGAPSPQDLITRLVSDLISSNVKKQPTGSVKIKLEWVTYGSDPNKSPEALLVFHDPTLTTIAELWQFSVAKARDMMAYAVLQSLEPAFGPSGTT